MSTRTLKDQFNPVFLDIRERSMVVDRFIDRNLYRVYIATLWSNVVLSPEEVGLSEEDIEDLHDLITAEIADAIGTPNGVENALHDLFKFISSKEGELAMQEARLTQSHKDLLGFFSSMILDPEGHKRYTDFIRDKQNPN